jgi:NADH:ubiquinone oxidoreductase subunit F (NADH-binding)
MTMSMSTFSEPATPPPLPGADAWPVPATLPRLLRGITAGRAPVGLPEHLQRWGPMPGAWLSGPTAPGLIDVLEAAGPRGRGGGAFPTGHKMRAVAEAAAKAGRHAVVVVNGAESEPASGKDHLLLTMVPHLVLDGADLAAAAVGATQIVVAVHRGSPAVAMLEAAIAQRRQAGRGPVPTVAEAPARYVASEASALAHWLSGGEAKPTVTPPRLAQRGVRRRPTLVLNAETMAQLALIARFGPDWFRAQGTGHDPGSVLLTVSGAVAVPGVYEVAGGSTGGDAIRAAGGFTADVHAVLVGGYGGRWVDAEAFAAATLDRRGLTTLGASLGCGIVLALPATACGLVESARVARWMAGQSAGQCGPCAFGLPDIAGHLEALAGGNLDAGGLETLARWGRQVSGRGACHHPDGVARFVASACEVFAAEVRHHLAGGCTAERGAPPVCPLPERQDLSWR